MRRMMWSLVGLLAVTLSSAAPSAARADVAADSTGTLTAAVVPATTSGNPSLGKTAATSSILTPGDRGELQYFRPRDIRGLNVFESPKFDAAPFSGKKLYWGFAFAQQFQGLQHRNSAEPKPATVNGQSVDTNQLMQIGHGFNNASANLYLDAQIARGMRVALTSYLSSRHHQETWVKDGYLQVDASPIDNEVLNGIMDIVTLRVGHFEVNYGDAHFRRSDNGNAFFNPFVGNLLMDAFTTEIGAEAYARTPCGLLAMAGVTGGEIRGQVQKPNDRSPSYLGKLGFDRKLNDATRVRLTSSLYYNKRAVNSTLYTGSRAGSRYYDVLENTQSTETAQAWSGDVQPGFRNRVTAWVVNPFVKIHGLEFFGNVEQASGKASTESHTRTWTQLAGEGTYRFHAEQLYVGGRYNVARGTLAGMGDVQVERVQVGGGWFVNPNIVAKTEYVRENYLKFPTSDIRHGGRFNGFMVEGVVTY